jgi:hypothetical protein
LESDRKDVKKISEISGKDDVWTERGGILVYGAI